MEAFTMEVAGLAARVEPLYESTRAYCGAYLTEKPAAETIAVSAAELDREQELLDQEAREEGLKRRKFSPMFLERSVIQRRLAELLLRRDTVLFHGSTVSVDGRAYLFTAACGVGKSTHVRLWREVFGDRAVMVNDDKPFLCITPEGVLACGTPWTGKHGLGSNITVPLKGICVLRRGGEDRIWPADLETLLPFLEHQCFQPEDAALAGKARELTRELVRRVQVWEMACTKDPNAARIAFGAMSKDEGKENQDGYEAGISF